MSDGETLTLKGTQGKLTHFGKTKEAFISWNRIFWGELFTRRKGHAKHFKSKYKNWHQRYLMYSFVFRIIALRRGKANECKGLSSKLTILMVSLDI